jgi:hypothetical protein
MTQLDRSPDDLAELLSDWARHLRGRNRAPRAIDSYLEVGTAFRAYLVRSGRSTLIGDITRRDVEDYLLDLSERNRDRAPDKTICRDCRPALPKPAAAVPLAGA